MGDLDRTMVALTGVDTYLRSRVVPLAILGSLAAWAAIIFILL